VTFICEIYIHFGVGNMNKYTQCSDISCRFTSFECVDRCSDVIGWLTDQSDWPIQRLRYHGCWNLSTYKLLRLPYCKLPICSYQWPDFLLLLDWPASIDCSLTRKNTRQQERFLRLEHVDPAVVEFKGHERLGKFTQVLLQNSCQSQITWRVTWPLEDQQH